MICFPHSKINLGLHVLAKRTDGYHNIESLLYPVQWYDCLEAIESNSLTMTQAGRQLDIPAGQNLVMKAYQLLKKICDIPPVKFFLLKNIPTGAGLGGGSSDAASAILMLCKMFNLDISFENRQAMMTELGMDCPFFTQQKPMLVGGRGDEMEPLDISLGNLYIVIAFPDVHVPTAWAYQQVKPNGTRESLKRVLAYPVNQWQGSLVNDFEGPISTKYPVIKDIKEKLYNAGAVYSAMSGSGSAVFGLFSEKPNKQTLIRNLGLPMSDLYFGKLS